MRKGNGSILNIVSRDRSGRLIHRSRFDVNDEKRTQDELRTWIRCLGVKKKTIKQVVARPIPMEDIEILKEQMKERIKKDSEQIKKLLKVQE